MEEIYPSKKWQCKSGETLHTMDARIQPSPHGCRRRRWGNGKKEAVARGLHWLGESGTTSAVAIPETSQTHYSHHRLPSSCTHSFHILLLLLLLTYLLPLILHQTHALPQPTPVAQSSPTLITINPGFCDPRLKEIICGLDCCREDEYCSNANGPEAMRCVRIKDLINDDNGKPNSTSATPTSTSTSTSTRTNTSTSTTKSNNGVNLPLPTAPPWPSPDVDSCKVSGAVTCSGANLQGTCCRVGLACVQSGTGNELDSGNGELIGALCVNPAFVLDNGSSSAASTTSDPAPTTPPVKEEDRQDQDPALSSGNSSPDSGLNLPTGALIGIGVGGALIACILIFFLIRFIRRHRRNASRNVNPGIPAIDETKPPWSELPSGCIEPRELSGGNGYHARELHEHGMAELHWNQVQVPPGWDMYTKDEGQVKGERKQSWGKPEEGVDVYELPP